MLPSSWVCISVGGGDRHDAADEDDDGGMDETWSVGGGGVEGGSGTVGDGSVVGGVMGGAVGVDVDAGDGAADAVDAPLLA